MIEISTKNLRDRLRMELPGEMAQRRMAPSVRFTREQIPDQRESKESSILIAVFPMEKGLGTLLMERTKIGLHGGQISFPGGKMDPEDLNAEQTALREAHEEVGLQMKDFEIVGSLSRLYVPNSNFWISPFIAISQSEPDWKLNPDEVTSVIQVKLEHLFDSSIKKRKVIRRNGYQIDAPYYDVNGHFVWGATAMIISEFEAIYQEFIIS